MEKRKIAAGLAAAALLGAVAGCGGSDATVKQQSGEKQTSFTYWSPMTRELASKFQTLAEVAMYKEREEKSGVHIEFIHPPVGQEGEQFNLMIASRELPDFIEYNHWPAYPGGPDKAVTDNVIYRLNDIIDKNAPNFKAALESNDEWRRQSMTDNGTIYAFPALNTGKYRTFGGMLIRDDWLKELGLEMPETIDEWENVLTAFKEKKGASAPMTGQSTLFAAGGYVSHFNNAYNVSKGVYREGDTVKYGPTEPAYKDWITKMNEWYEKGLIDKDFATNATSAADAKILNGDSGVVFGFLGGGLGKYLSAKEGENFSLTGAPMPVMNKGDVAHFPPLENEVKSPYLAITTACKDPESAAEWVDYWYTEEGFDMTNFGVEGLSYNMVDGKHVYTDVILNNPEGLSVAEAQALYFRAGVGFNQHEEYLMQSYKYPQQLDSLKIWSEITEESKKYALPMLTYTTEEADEIAVLATDIGTTVEENIVKFVIGQYDMSQWDTFQQQLKDIGVDRYIEIQQAALERYLNR